VVKDPELGMIGGSFGSDGQLEAILIIRVRQCSQLLDE
jgi:hypothetical protein